MGLAAQADAYFVEREDLEAAERLQTVPNQYFPGRLRRQHHAHADVQDVARKPRCSDFSDISFLPVPEVPPGPLPKPESKKTKKPFRKPTFEELQNYINEKRYDVSAERFMDYYDSNGWMVGRNHMKDWKAAVRNWNARSESGSFREPSTGDILLKMMQNGEFSDKE